MTCTCKGSCDSYNDTLWPRDNAYIRQLHKHFIRVVQTGYLTNIDIKDPRGDQWKVHRINHDINYDKCY